MRLELSRFVEGDLEAIADFIAEDNPERAVSFIRQIRHEILGIGKQPLLYQLRPEIGEAARLAVVGRYVILFRVVARTVRPAVARTVRIERVVYGGRDLPQLFEIPEPASPE
ncbi:MAG: type II toxin-antitoxin system RelE/ParE family toxin [Terracidiphilus sp.]